MGCLDCHILSSTSSVSVTIPPLTVEIVGTCKLLVLNILQIEATIQAL